MGFFDEASCVWAETSSGALWDPPEGQFPGTVGLQSVVMARTKQVAVALTGLSGFTTGFEFTIGAEWSSEMARRSDDQISLSRSIHFGLIFDDGRKGATFSRSADNVRRDITSKDIVVRPTSIGGGRLHRRWTYWAWPLPSSGAVTFVCEWPFYDIPESSITIASSSIIEAAAKSVLAFQ